MNSRQLPRLTAPQRRVVAASFLGWTLDAFDFFLLVFTLPAIAATFEVSVPTVAQAIFLTLAMRVVGAFVFGRLADRFGRRRMLMLDILCYSALGAAAAFSPSLTVFLALRALFGVAMGGEWGLGAAWTMESIPPAWRGRISGLLQCGYPVGYLLAAAVYGALFGADVFGFSVGWRELFLASLLPAALVVYMRSRVPESPIFDVPRVARPGASWAAVRSHAWPIVHAVMLMTLMNLFSHGTQDLYPVFLQQQHGFGPERVGALAIVANLGAIAGGLLFGAWSERLGRRDAISIAAVLVLPAIPLWAFGSTPLLLAVGAFLVQFAVQGAWGVVPAHLNELAPAALRATLPGFVYQAGNLLAALNAPLQSRWAESAGHGYGATLALTAAVVGITLALLVRVGPEARGRPMIA